MTGAGRLGGGAGRGLAAVLACALALAGCGMFDGKSGRPKTPTRGERLPVLTYEAALEPDPEIADTPVTLPPPVMNESWTQPGGNESKSLGQLALADQLRQVWTARIGRGSDRGRRLNAAPVVAGGRVFTIDTEASVRAFDAESGRPLWESRITRPGEKDSVAFGGGISTDGTRVYATSGYGVAAAFDVASGARIWSRTLGAPLRGSPAIADDDLYIVSQDNQFYALDAATGETRWDATGTIEPAGLLGAATPAVTSDTVIAGFSSGELVALRRENGRTVWQDALARTGRSTALAALADIDASPVVDNGRVYAIGHGGRMVALELITGQRVWERNLAGTSLPWAAGDHVFALTVDARLAALTRAGGRVRWVSQLRRWEDEEDKKGPVRWAGPVLAGGRLLLTNSLGELVSVSPADGATISAIRLGEAAFLPPVVANATLFVLTDDGTLGAWR